MKIIKIVSLILSTFAVAAIAGNLCYVPINSPCRLPGEVMKGIICVPGSSPVYVPCRIREGSPNEIRQDFAESGYKSYSVSTSSNLCEWQEEKPVCFQGGIMTVFYKKTGPLFQLEFEDNTCKASLNI
jgi:hypothetical protein